MKIIIPDLVYAKVMHWVNKTDIEVSGFGTVKYDKDTRSFMVTDAYLLKQEGGAAHTDIDANAINKLMFESMNDEGNLKWWWHSHVRMATFWSGTDVDTIKELGKQGWIVATVFNQLNSMKSAVSYLSDTADFGSLLHYNEDIPTEIVKPGITPDVIAQWDASFDANVSEKKFAPPYSVTGQYRFNDYGYESAATEEKEGEKMQKIQEKINHKSLLDPLRDNWDPGIFGYGLEKEAAALHMTPKAYAAVINKPNNDIEIYKLEQRLMNAESQGLI